MKKRTDNYYQKSLTIGRNEDGKPIRKVFYGKTQRDVNDKVAEYKANHKKGDFYIEEKNISLRDFSVLWLDTFRSNKSANTNEMYSRIVHTHLIPALGDFPLKSITSIQLQQLLNNKASSEKLTRTVEQLNMVIKQLFTFAFEEGYIFKNVSSGLSLPKIEHKQSRAFTDQEKHVIANAKLKPKERMFTDILFCFGLRRGEALGLQLNDFDTENHLLTVSRQIIFVNNERIISPHTKTDAGIRTLGIPEVIRLTLYAYLDKIDVSINKDAFLFTNLDGSPVSKSGYTKMWKRIMAKYKEIDPNIDNITPHQFRHNYCTMVYYSGVDLKQCQYLMGHNAVDITLKVYTHLDTKSSINSDQINDTLSEIYNKPEKV